MPNPKYFSQDSDNIFKAAVCKTQESRKKGVPYGNGLLFSVGYNENGGNIG